MFRITCEDNERTLVRLREALEAHGDMKCYFPYNECMGLNRKRLVRKIVERHCWRYGHCEGRYTYHPMVS
jgi:hypothetical protein